MDGVQVEAMRIELGANVPQFARLLGVHQGTVYRWVGSASELHLDPLHDQLLGHMRTALDGARHQVDGGERWRRQLMVALEERGTLHALAVLLLPLVPGEVRSTVGANPSGPSVVRATPRARSRYRTAT